MGKEIKKEEEVCRFLETVSLLAEDKNNVKINNWTWADGKVNKTQLYMAETGIHKQDICDIIEELTVENYSATKTDVNPNFPNEEVWEFGINKMIIDTNVDLYIKLKVREISGKYLLVMSFHPEQPASPKDKLEFPYSSKCKE